MGPEAKSSFVTYPRFSKFKQQSQDSNPDFFFLGVHYIEY